jgi:hypothetical protein
MSRSYRDFCRPAHQVQRTHKQPGDLILHRVDQPAERVAGKEKVVAIRGRG